MGPPLECEVSAPGKVILHGEHSAVFGKTALAVGLGLRTVARLEEFPDASSENVFVLSLRNIDLRDLEFDCDDFKKRVLTEVSAVCEWSDPLNVGHDRLLSAIVAHLGDYQNGNGVVLTETQRTAVVMVLYAFSAFTAKGQWRFRSFKLDARTELKVGSGAGSSASFAVSLSAVMLVYFRQRCPNEYALKFPEWNSETLSVSEKRLVSSWAYNLERIAHGNPSGIDNTTSAFGSLVEFRKGAEPTCHDIRTKLRVCLVNTNVSRNTKVLVQKVEEFRERHPEVVDSLMDTCDCIAKRALKIIQEIDVAADNEIVNNNFNLLTELFVVNHRVLNTLGVSHPSLEKVVSEAQTFGLGCKLTGAGGGGFAIILLPPFISDEIVGSLVDRISSAGFGADVVDLGGEGVRIEKSVGG